MSNCSTRIIAGAKRRPTYYTHMASLEDIQQGQSKSAIDEEGKTGIHRKMPKSHAIDEDVLSSSV
jgi:hypothetical protein